LPPDEFRRRLLLDAISSLLPHFSVTDDWQISPAPNAKEEFVNLKKWISTTATLFLVSSLVAAGEN